MQLMTSAMGTHHRAPQGNRDGPQGNRDGPQGSRNRAPNFNTGWGQSANSMNNSNNPPVNWEPNRQQHRQGNYSNNPPNFNQSYYEGNQGQSHNRHGNQRQDRSPQQRLDMRGNFQDENYGNADPRSYEDPYNPYSNEEFQTRGSYGNQGRRQGYYDRQWQPNGPNGNMEDQEFNQYQGFNRNYRQRGDNNNNYRYNNNNNNNNNSNNSYNNHNNNNNNNNNNYNNNYNNNSRNNNNYSSNNYDSNRRATNRARDNTNTYDGYQNRRPLATAPKFEESAPPPTKLISELKIPHEYREVCSTIYLPQNQSRTTFTTFPSAKEVRATQMQLGTSQRNPEANNLLHFPEFKEVSRDREKVYGWKEVNSMDYDKFEAQGNELVKQIIASVEASL